LSITSLDVTYDRSLAIAYSQILMTTPYTIITNNNEKTYKRITDYILNVEKSIWILMLLIIIVIVIFNKVHLKINKYGNIENKISKHSDIWDLIRILLYQSEYTIKIS